MRTCNKAEGYIKQLEDDIARIGKALGFDDPAAVSIDEIINKIENLWENCEGG